MDVNKTLLFSIIRHLLTFGAGWLVARGVISQDLADAWLTETAGLLVAGVLVVGTVVWKYFKVRFDRIALEVAVQQPPPPPVTEGGVDAAIADVKAQVNAENSAVVPY